jgi:hypothetical protein
MFAVAAVQHHWQRALSLVPGITMIEQGAQKLFCLYMSHICIVAVTTALDLPINTVLQFQRDVINGHADIPTVPYSSFFVCPYDCFT